MKSSYDIVIVGGGMVGAALACALGNSSLKVALLDRTPAPPSTDKEYDLRVSAITWASRALFENLGVWEGMERRRAAPVREMQVWSGEGSGSIHFNAAEIGEAALSWIIENNVIQSALIERLHQFTNVHYLCPVEIADITLADNGAVVTLKDGRSLNAKLLVGADGADSVVRHAAAIETQSLNLHQKGIVATVTTEKPHEATARQRFLATGPLAFLPLGEAHTCSIVWSADTARADHLTALDDVAFIAELQKSFGDSLGLIQKISPRAAFPLALSHAKAYTAPHLALVGDAAHTVHPLAGQGVNLGFLDAATLAEVLLDAAAKQKDIGAHEVLRRYERWRKGDNLAMVSITGGFKYLFGNELPVVSQLRNWGLDLTNAATPIKNLIMRRASGLEGDLPKLTRRAL
ncbi:MAG: UbiH/UbiF/VisC/COQ6 family ubiquinone biosynthesis hydroxylase [Sulfuricaulis sp.]|uniref:UbiH/UbiF/VisC/COQ6 family ubiquinone biosynthesis hydroxylase n=1 Tax=Sulfuricaulis sp. TaxID=2003553 RepID=UPI0025D36D19|nr:UbiH/UbiF/VisC/COQ6 family ubiquinone biosynthesis hydroxylase [Sulfuricaulis sp.]MCR4346048.1 UbiH/UbiF/VisC/COQ6 family ubiquinone biosynthesis hydroxylase [Sulfuricaulis sp.]